MNTELVKSKKNNKNRSLLQQFPAMCSMASESLLVCVEIFVIDQANSSLVPLCHVT